MSQDAFTEVTRQSWLSRLSESVKGVLVGLVLLLAAFPLLFWNEGRAVKTAKSLEEGAAAVVSIQPSPVDPANEKKLVHMMGKATTEETLRDPELYVSQNAIKLIRDVQMYQWEEHKRSEKKKKLGGGTETVTTYTYETTWSSRLIDSDEFRKPEGHSNPDHMPFESQSFVAEEVQVGDFTLCRDLVAKMQETEPLRLDPEMMSALPAALKGRVQLSQGQLYMGANPSSPAVGDVRIRYKVVRPGIVSLVARQIGNTFEAYRASSGGQILLLEEGVHSADSMFEAAQAANTALTWVVRAVGFFLMFFGLTMFFRPLVVVADVVPIVGTMLGAGLGVFSAFMAAALSSVTIAVSWLFFRPLLGITLLALAGGALWLLVSIGLKKTRRHATQAARAPA